MYAQDGAFQGYHLRLQFEKFEPVASDSIMYVEFYKNASEIESSLENKNRYIELIKSDLDSACFELAEGVHFIGSSPKTILPPTIIMKVGVRRHSSSGITMDYEKMVLIVFNVPLENFARISLMDININTYLQMPDESIAIKVLSKDSYEIVPQETMMVKPVFNTLVKFD